MSGAQRQQWAAIRQQRCLRAAASGGGGARERHRVRAHVARARGRVGREEVRRLPQMRLATSRRGVNGAATSYSVRYVVLRVDLGGAAVCSFSSRSQQFHASRCTTRFRMRASKASLSTETVAHAAEKSAEMPQSASSPDLSLQMLLRGGCDYGRGWTR